MAARTPENAFFEFFLREVSTTPPPARPIYPAGGDPCPLQRTRNGYTAQAAAQAVPEPGRDKYQGRPCKAQRTPERWTRCTGPHSIPDRPRRVDRNGGGCWRVGSASETVQIWTQRSGSKIYLIFEYICCACNRKPLYSVSKV